MFTTKYRRQVNNESRTDIEQMLLDLSQAVADSNHALTEKQRIFELIGELKASLDVEDMKSAEKIFRSRQYANVRFSQMSLLQADMSPSILMTLTHAELKICVLFAQILEDQCIQISHDDLAEIVGVSSRQIRKVIKSLIDKSILSVQVPAIPRKGESAIYRMNTAIVRSGRARLNPDDVDKLKLNPDNIQSVEDAIHYIERAEKSFNFRRCSVQPNDGRKLYYVKVEHRVGNE